MMFGVLPAVAALGVIVVSVQLIIRAFGVVQLVLGFPAIVAAAWSLWVLKNIFVDAAWPTYLPHIVITASLSLVMIQWHLARPRPVRPDARRARALMIVGGILLVISSVPLLRMARELAGSMSVDRRFAVERIQSHEPGIAGGALESEIGGHLVKLEDEQPFDASGDARADGPVRILIDGRDYSTDSRAEIRLNSKDANRYWGYVYLMKLIDRDQGTQHLVVAQNVGAGRYRTLTVSADGSVVEDEFDYGERCDRPLRVRLIDSVVPSPIGRCFGSAYGSRSLIYPVVYPWITAALGLAWVIDTRRSRRQIS
jgi:hypothetical protein